MRKTDLLDIIFSHLNFYDNSSIVQLLLYHKNKIAVSKKELKQQLSNEKFKISLVINHRFFRYFIHLNIENEKEYKKRN